VSQRARNRLVRQCPTKSPLCNRGEKPFANLDCQSEILVNMAGVRKAGSLVLHVAAALATSASLLPTARAQFVQQGNKLVEPGQSGVQNKATPWHYRRTEIRPVWADLLRALRFLGWLQGCLRNGSVQRGCTRAPVGFGARKAQSWPERVGGPWRYPQTEIRAVVGSPLDNNFVGEAWAYARSGGVWSQQAKLVSVDAVGNAEQGHPGTTSSIAGIWTKPSSGRRKFPPPASQTNGCAAAPLKIVGTDVAQDPGTWQVRMLRTGVLEFTLPFTDRAVIPAQQKALRVVTPR